MGAAKGVVNAVRNGATALGPPIAAMLVAASGSFSSSLVAFGVAAGRGRVSLALAPEATRAERRRRFRCDRGRLPPGRHRPRGVKQVPFAQTLRKHTSNR